MIPVKEIEKLIGDDRRYQNSCTLADAHHLINRQKIIIDGLYRLCEEQQERISIMQGESPNDRTISVDEAIDVLKGIRDFTCCPGSDARIAVDMAIEALKERKTISDDLLQDGDHDA